MWSSTHISALRLAMRTSEGDLAKEAQAQAEAARRWLGKTLAAFDANDPPVLAGDVPPPAALLKATLALLAAARAYRRACARV